MRWFKIDGREWNVRVIEPEESFTITYTENTGRTLSEGAPMILDPIGTFFNYTLTIARKKGEKDEFDELFDYLSRPRRDAMLVVLPKNQSVWKTKNSDGEEVEGFYAYVSKGKRKIIKIYEYENGDIKSVDYDSFSVSFIATKAQVLPDE